MSEFLQTPTLKVRRANRLASAWRRSTVGFGLSYQLTPSPHAFHPELHLYEGLISRLEVPSLWQTSLHMAGLRKLRGTGISGAWQASARALLYRIFQKWSPSDKQSRESLCNDLSLFQNTLGSAHTRMKYRDNSQPPMVKVGAARRVELKTLISS